MVSEVFGKSEVTFAEAEAGIRERDQSHGYNLDHWARLTTVYLDRRLCLQEIDRLRVNLGRTVSRIAQLEAALRDLMPLLAECDCVYPDRAEPLCPCRAARSALAPKEPT